MSQLSRDLCAGLLTITVALWWVDPGSGIASTVSVGTNVEPVYGDEVLYSAAPGERNEVSLHMEPDLSSPGSSYIDLWTVTDSGAVIHAGESCTSLDAHTAQCRPREISPMPGVAPMIRGPLSSAQVLLGDRDDRLIGVTSSSSHGGWVVARGGAGDDQITGGADRDDLRGNAGDDQIFGADGPDRLDGGGGRDQLYGGAGADRLADGDRDGAGTRRHPGPDLLDGGTQQDLVSYRARRVPVSVDLADPGPDGRRGEGDVLRSVEAVYGGHGDDLLVGDSHANVLDGRGGQNRLTGGRGNDVLRSSGFPIVCGGGHDTVSGDHPSNTFEHFPWHLEFLRHGCENIETYWDGVVLPAQPSIVRRRSLAFRLQCPMGEDQPDICSATMRLTRWTAPRRRLATGSSDEDRGGQLAWLHLSRLGRRLASRPNGLRVAVHTDLFAEGDEGGTSSFTVSWGIRLVTPR